jgi:hypothetical protein
MPPLLLVTEIVAPRGMAAWVERAARRRRATREIPIRRGKRDSFIRDMAASQY